MKKKEQITLHKNLQSGKTQASDSRIPGYHIPSNRAIVDKNR